MQNQLQIPSTILDTSIMQERNARSGEADGEVRDVYMWQSRVKMVFK